LPAAGRHSIAEKAKMGPPQHLGLVVTQLLEDLSRALEVGEEKCDGSDAYLSHGSPPSAVREDYNAYTARLATAAAFYGLGQRLQRIVPAVLPTHP
jgi:hypothetical protein